jgi:hypothetical protein
MPVAKRGLRLKLQAVYPYHMEKFAQRMIYESFGKFNERVYPVLIEAIPLQQEMKYPKGFVRSKVKLMIRTTAGIKYRVIGVPGGSREGTPAYHALSALRSLQEGRPGVIVVNKFMTWHAKGKGVRQYGSRHPNPHTHVRGPGQKMGPKSWIATQRIETAPIKPRQLLSHVIEKHASNYLKYMETFANKHKNEKSYKRRVQIWK